MLFHRITQYLGILEGISAYLLVQPHPEHIVQGRVQVGVESLQRKRLHELPGQPIGVIIRIYKLKKLFVKYLGNA